MCASAASIPATCLTAMMLRAELEAEVAVGGGLDPRGAGARRGVAADLDAGLGQRRDAGVERGARRRVPEQRLGGVAGRRIGGLAVDGQPAAIAGSAAACR